MTTGFISAPPVADEVHVTRRASGGGYNVFRAGALLGHVRNMGGFWTAFGAADARIASTHPSKDEAVEGLIRNVERWRQ